MKRLIEILETGVRGLDGSWVASGTVKFLEAGTQTLATVYQEFDFENPYSNPATLDTSGRLQGVYYDGRLDLVIQDSLGAVVRTIRNVGTDDSDITVTGISQFPVGFCGHTAGSSAPAGWLIRDGSAVSRAIYSDLFSAIGTTFGSGDGSTTFNLPASSGRVDVGSGTGSGLTARTLGALIGAETHELTTAELAAHTHGVSGNTGTQSANHTHTYGDSRTEAIVAAGAGASVVDADLGATTLNTGSNSVNHTHAISLTSASTGSGNGHNNMQPGVVLTPIIKF